MTRDEAERLQAGLSAWVEEQPSCRALALVGSWARGAARTDSDLDLCVLTDQLDRWTSDDTWLRDLLVRSDFAPAALGLEVHGVARSWRARLISGAELEITFADLGWASPPLDAGTRRVASDGMRQLVDKDGLLRAVQDAVRETDQGRLQAGSCP